MILLLQYAQSFLGTPYIWGGRSHDGIDCSGYVLEILKSAGEKLPADDMTAQTLFDFYEKNGEWNRQQLGALAFYGEAITKVTHVAFLIDDMRIIEAGGGGHLVLTRADAAEKGAFVRQRLVDYRKDRVAIIRPYYRGIKQI